MSCLPSTYVGNDARLFLDYWNGNKKNQWLCCTWWWNTDENDRGPPPLSQRGTQSCHPAAASCRTLLLEEMVSLNEETGAGKKSRIQSQRWQWCPKSDQQFGSWGTNCTRHCELRLSIRTLHQGHYFCQQTFQVRCQGDHEGRSANITAWLPTSVTAAAWHNSSPVWLKGHEGSHGGKITPERRRGELKVCTDRATQNPDRTQQNITAVWEKCRHGPPENTLEFRLALTMAHWRCILGIFKSPFLRGKRSRFLKVFCKYTKAMQRTWSWKKRQVQLQITSTEYDPPAAYLIFWMNHTCSNI